MRNQPAPYGFTLLEVLITLGIFAVIAAVAVDVGFHTHSGFTTSDDVDVVVALLQKARSESMQGICIGGTCTGALPHGVHVEEGSVTLFQGDTFNPHDAANELFVARNAATRFAGTEVQFAPYSGDAIATGTIAVFDASQLKSTVAVGQEGQITFSH